MILIEDTAHSIGCQINKCPTKPYVGSFADLTTFSFHPVKNITTCEEGMIMTNNEEYYNQMKEKDIEDVIGIVKKVINFKS